MSSNKTPERDSSFRKNVDDFKRSLAKIPDQLDTRLEQLNRRGVTEGPEITAINELLAEKGAENTTEKVAKATRRKVRKWDTDWARKLQ